MPPRLLGLTLALLALTIPAALAAGPTTTSAAVVVVYPSPI